MKLPKEGIFLLADNGEVTEVNRAKLIKTIRKGIGNTLPEEHVDYCLKAVEKGEELDFDTVEADERKNWKAALKAVTDAVKFHHGHVEALKKEAEEAKAEAERERNAIVLAGAGGNKTAELMIETSIDGLNAMVNKVTNGKFKATTTGLVLVGKEDKVTSEDLAFLIGGLASSTEGLDTVRTSVVWNLGDACKWAEEHFPDIDIVGQVANLHGKQKHTIREAIRLCEAWPHDERIPELTATHHQEINNYKEAVIKKGGKAALSRVIELVKEGEVECVVKTKSGKEEEHRKALSCSKTRALLQEAAGKKTTKTAKAGKDGYLYIGNIDGVVYSSDKLSKKALVGDYTVIDLGARAVLKPNGKVHYTIQPLDASYFEVDGGKKDSGPSSSDLPE